MEYINIMPLYLLHAKKGCFLIVQALMRRGLANLEMDRPEEAIKGEFVTFLYFMSIV